MTARLFAGFVLIFAMAAAIAAPPEPRVVQVGPRVFALIGLEELPNGTNQGLIGNSTLIVGDMGAVLVDSGFTHEIGLGLRRIAQRITSKPITHVINTHAHGDHFLGNTAFPEAQIISSERCQASVRSDGQRAVDLIRAMTGQELPLTRAVAAQRTYRENTTTLLEIDGVRMELWVPRGSHTPGDLLVFLPDDNVLVAGDILSNGIVPNFADSDAKAWLQTLERVQKLAFETAIPGHGQIMAKGEVTAFSVRMNRLYLEIQDAYRRGVSDGDVRNALDLSEWKSMRRYEEIGRGINHIYLEIESREF